MSPWLLHTHIERIRVLEDRTISVIPLPGRNGYIGWKKKQQNKVHISILDLAMYETHGIVAAREGKFFRSTVDCIYLWLDQKNSN
jgi:hypothetical protein